LTVCASAALALCASLVLAAPSWGWAKFTVTPIASGLDNPRDLAFGPDGHLYVAEAGHGGSECIPAGPGESQCVGFTSGISRIDSNGPHKVVSGLVSLGEPGGFGATGVDGISFLGKRAFVIETGSSDALPPSSKLSPQTLARARAQLGRLGEFNWSAQGRVVADVGHFDFQWSKQHTELVPGQFPDANPYAVLATQWGELVLDAGSNTLDFVSPSGAVSIQAFFPNPPSSDAVPTCLDRGPDGAIYVGELTGGGNKPGASVVWRWTPGHQPTMWASGLTAVTGCGFAADGQFYAVEFSTLGLDKAAPETGAVVRVPPHSTSPTTIVSGLSFPGGFERGSNAIYLSNWSIAPADSKGGPTGQVIRITH
jgi:hypothetical protein